MRAQIGRISERSQFDGGVVLGRAQFQIIHRSFGSMPSPSMVTRGISTIYTTLGELMVEKGKTKKESFYYAVPLVVIGTIGGSMYFSFEKGYGTTRANMIAKKHTYNDDDFRAGSNDTSLNID
jgi:hypothetical protein